MNEDDLWSWLVNSLCFCVADTDDNKNKIPTWSNIQQLLWLLHSFRPDLILPDEFQDDDISKINSQKVLKIAECELGIPRLLNKSETESLDEDSAADDLPFFTYLAFVNAILDKTIPRCHSNEKVETAVVKPALKISRQHFLWCAVCQSDVSLFERFFVDENVRHRKCFVCERCNKRLHVGLYRTTNDNEGFECLDHEKEDLMKKFREPDEINSKGKQQHPNGDVTSETTCQCDVISEEPEKISNECPSDKLNKTSNEENQSETVCCPKEQSSLYPQLPTADEKATEAEQESSQNVPNVPKAPPRKKKVEVPPSSPAKPLPAVRTKLKPKTGVDDVILRKQQEKPASTNPFGSDDDDDSVSSLSSDNPFNDSDYDSEITEANRRRSLMAPSETRSKVRSDMTKSYTAGTTPTMLDVQQDQRSNSRSPLNSVSKKRPAPQPPQVSQPNSLVVTPLKIPSRRKKRPAPPRPLPFKRQIRSDITMSPDEILSNLKSTDNEMALLEERGRLLESEIRQSKEVSDDNNDNYRRLIEKWLELVRSRVELIHRESEFAFLWRERQLDEFHAEIEFQLRCIIEKPESEKREDDGQKEAYLLQKLLRVIDEKSRLAESDIAATSPHKEVKFIETTLNEATSNLNLNEKEVKKKKRMKLRLKKLKKKLIISGK